jgi:hypothetical protein
VGTILVQIREADVAYATADRVDRSTVRAVEGSVERDAAHGTDGTHLA